MTSVMLFVPFFCVSTLQLTQFMSIPFHGRDRRIPANSGLLIVFFEEDEGIRLDTVWKAPIVPKLPLEVFYWQAKLKPKPKTPKTREVFFQNNEASSTSVSRGTY